MKKILLLMVFIVVTALLTACGVDNLELSKNISAPKNINLPIEGRYVVEEFKLSTVSAMTEEEAKGYIGREAVFHEDVVFVGDNYCYEPNFKIKYVKAKEYLIYQYKTNPEFLNITDEEIQIVSISGAKQFFYDFIKLSDDAILVNIDGVFFYLRKAFEDVKIDRAELYSAPQEITLRTADAEREAGLDSAILLGLKSLNLEDGLESWTYRTIFIRSLDKSIVSIQEMENILLPRMTGFWKIEVEREEVDGKVNDRIKAYPINRGADINIRVESEEIFSMEEAKLDPNSTIKNILFVGNNYISIENIHYRNKGQRYLELYPVDNVEEGTPIKISDIMGEAGKEALLEGFNMEIVSNSRDKNKGLINFIPKEESFGLFRRNGFWIFRGRVNYIKNGDYVYEDFNIPTIPLRELISYDELYIPWKEIKAKKPDTLDAFTSPNEDIVIILTRHEIIIYPIEENTIGNEPIGKVQLLPGEKVIMAEWAIGRYPQIWEKEFIKEGN